MKLNHEYIRKILMAIESLNLARPYLSDILKLLELDDFNEEFLLHYEVLLDYGFIESMTDNGSNGVCSVIEGEVSWTDIPIRLTAIGHEFIEAINKIEIWEIIKTEFKDSSVKTIFKVAKDLAEGFARKKVESLLEE